MDTGYQSFKILQFYTLLQSNMVCWKIPSSTDFANKTSIKFADFPATFDDTRWSYLHYQIHISMIPPVLYYLHYHLISPWISPNFPMVGEIHPPCKLFAVAPGPFLDLLERRSSTELGQGHPAFGGEGIWTNEHMDQTNCIPSGNLT